MKYANAGYNARGSFSSLLRASLIWISWSDETWGACLNSQASTSFAADRVATSEDAFGLVVVAGGAAALILR